MTKKTYYNFHQEFSKIDQRIAEKEYREAGYICGYMLEYMLLKIYEKFKGSAEADTLEKLETLTKGGKINTFKLGRLISFFSMQYRSATQASNKYSPPVLKIICQTLKVNYKQVRFIEFEELNDIRNRSVHPNIDKGSNDPTYDEIKHFKADLDIIKNEFKHIFNIELLDPPKKTKKQEQATILPCEVIIVIISIVLIGMTAFFVYNY